MPDIEQLLNDPEFLQLPEEEQNAFIDEMKQKDLGVIPKTENLLSRAAKIGMEPFMSKPPDMAHPFQSSIDSTMGGLKRTPGLGSYMQAHDVKSGLIDNPALDIASDPETYLGAGAVFKGIKNAPRVFKNKFGSKGFGKSMEKLQSKSPDSRVNYFDVVMRHSDNPSVKKVMEKAGVMDKFGGQSMDEAGATSEKLANLSLQESQDFLNAIKDEVRQAVKIGNIKPKELGVSRFISDLVSSQDKAFKGFSGARKSYGLYKKVGKAGKAISKASLTGAGLYAGGRLGHEAVKAFIGK